MFCEIVSPANAELKVPPIRVERPQREKRDRPPKPADADATKKKITKKAGSGRRTRGIFGEVADNDDSYKDDIDDLFDI